MKKNIPQLPGAHKFVAVSFIAIKTMFGKRIAPVTNVYSKEIFLNNSLETDVQRIFYPFNYIMSLFLSSRFNLQPNSVRPISRKSLILRSLVVGFMIIATAYRIHLKDISRFGHNIENISIVLLVSYFLIISRCMDYVCMFILNIVHRYNNVVLIVIIQSIHKSIHFNGIRSFIFWNWVLVVASTVFNVLAFILFGVICHFVDLFCVCELVIICFDVDFLYTIRVLVLMIKYLNGWIENFRMLHFHSGNDEMYCKKMFNVYCKILKVFDLYKSIFQVLVSIHIVKVIV